MHLKSKISCVLLLSFLLCHSSINAQADSIYQRKKQQRIRETYVYSGIGVFYCTLSYGLYTTWYKKYTTRAFHYFNDNNEWLQMDKVGHSFSCYSEAVNGINLMNYVGLPKKKALFVGAFIGFGMQSIIEVMDGYSNQWGFSWGDMGANLLGTSLAISQQLLWDEQRIKICYGFHQTSLRALRPEVLGDNYVTGVLKDYNGLTGWLSVNVRSFAPNSKISTWLNLAVGIGAYNMVTGNPGDNIVFYDSKGQAHHSADYHRYRILYFAPDINLQKIPFIKKRKILFALARFLAPLKVPLPTLQYDKNKGFGFRAFYF